MYVYFIFYLSTLWMLQISFPSGIIKFDCIARQIWEQLGGLRPTMGHYSCTMTKMTKQCESEYDCKVVISPRWSYSEVQLYYNYLQNASTAYSGNLSTFSPTFGANDRLWREVAVGHEVTEVVASHVVQITDHVDLSLEMYCNRQHQPIVGETSQPSELETAL